MCGGNTRKDGLQKTEIIRSTAPHDHLHVCTPIALLYCINGLVRTAGELSAGSSEGKEEHIFFAPADFLKGFRMVEDSGTTGTSTDILRGGCSSLE